VLSDNDGDILDGDGHGIEWGDADKADSVAVINSDASTVVVPGVESSGTGGASYMERSVEVVRESLGYLSGVDSNEESSGRYLLECAAHETLAKIDIQFFDSSGLKWELLNSSGSIVKEGGQNYTFSGEEDGRQEEVCIDLSDCYMFKVIGDETSEITYSKYIIMVNDEVQVTGNGVYAGYMSKFGQKCVDRCDMRQKPLLSPVNNWEDATQRHYDERTHDVIDVISSISGRDALANVSSAQYKAVCWLIFDNLRQVAVTNASLVQRYVLAVLYYATGGPFWSDSPMVLSSYSECRWLYYPRIGGCDANNEKVIKIELRNRNLTGYIPSELSKLRGLEVLSLANNYINGIIPTELGEILNNSRESPRWREIKWNNNDQLLVHVNKVNVSTVSLITRNENQEIRGTINDTRMNSHLKEVVEGKPLILDTKSARSSSIMRDEVSWISPCLCSY